MRRWLPWSVVLGTLLVMLVLPIGTPAAPATMERRGASWEEVCGSEGCAIAFYPYQRYYQDAGAWKAIDETFRTACPQGDFCVPDNLYQAALDDGAVTLTRGTASLSFALRGVEGGFPAPSFAAPARDHNRITYQGVFPGVDLTYAYFARDFKEEIRVHDPVFSSFSQDPVFSYTLSGEGFFLAEPWVCDAAGACLSLASSRQGTAYRFTIPLAWLTDPERAYPLTIDPTVSLDNQSVTFQGMDVRNPTVNPNVYTRQSQETIKVGRFTGGTPSESKVYRGMIQWNTSAFPDNANVTSVHLVIRASQAASCPGNTNVSLQDLDQQVAAYPDTNDGNRLLFGDIGNASLGREPFNWTNITGEGFYNLSLAADWDLEAKLAQDWFSVGFAAQREQNCPGTATTNETRFDSPAAANSSNRPVLYVTYRATITTFNNSLPAENLTFTGNQSIIRWLDIPADAVAISGFLELAGFESSGSFPANPSLEIGTPNGVLEWTITGQLRGLLGLLEAFDDGNATKNITFPSRGGDNFTEFVRLPRHATVQSAQLTIEGVSPPEGTFTGDCILTENPDTSAAVPFGVTENGSSLWITFTDTKSVEKYRKDSFFENSVYENETFDLFFSPRGITFNGTHFWIVSHQSISNNSVFLYYANGTYTGFNFTHVGPSPSEATGITQNGSFIWVVDARNFRVYKYFANGTYTGDSFPTVGTTANGPSGITTDNAYLWVSDMRDDKVYKHYMNGTYTGESWGLPETSYKDITEDGEYFYVVEDCGSNDLGVELYYKHKFPENVTVDTGNDTHRDVELLGELNNSNSPVAVDLNASAVQAYLAACVPDASRICDVPLTFGSATGGRLLLSQLNITYTNVSRTLDFSPAVNAVLPACTCVDCKLQANMCSVPFSFHADQEGLLEYSALLVEYV